MSDLTWQEFERVDLRVGTVVAAEAFPEARKPAYRLRVDFGDDVGIRQSSAQLTDLYEASELVGRQVIGVVNFPRKQIGPFMSECLVTGFVQADGSVVLAVPDRPCDNGLRLA
ncbi:MAG: tRNA-binding protein [Woeseiaceae bacterium]|nr:tRNA-binding protein [Woeseiaceae bacterium]